MSRKIGVYIVIYSLVQYVLVFFFTVISLSSSLELPSWTPLLGIATILLMLLGFLLIGINKDIKWLTSVKKYYLAISIFLVLIGASLRAFREYYGHGGQGANVNIVIGVIWYCFGYAPMQLKLSYNKWKPLSNNWYEILLLSSSNFVGINLMVMGILFKHMHWPGSPTLLLLGAIISLTSLFGWNYKFRKEVIKRKESEEKIREQYTNIQDSIAYAQRIQTAKLPAIEEIRAEFPDSFILFKPKDVVSGDFYYFNKVNNTVLLAAADCTGHGVPGALMSMLCYEKLDEAAMIDTTPSAMLSFVNKRLKTSLKQTENFGSVREGMDIALCSIRLDNLNTVYSGANRPIWVIRKGQNTIEEIKPTKRSIGGFTNEEQVFEQHEIQIEKGDSIYLFSDGYADTFSENDNKITTTKFKELLLNSAERPMSEQKKYLNEFVDTWKGNIEQTDDILVIGFRI